MGRGRGPATRYPFLRSGPRLQLTARLAKLRISHVIASLANSASRNVDVLRGFVSAHSQNDVAGTMQRLLFPSHPRQCGLFTFRMFAM